MRSFSEIETISKRASRGAGFTWGVSEEIGKSVRLLEMYGLPGILYLKSYLEKISNHNYQKIKKSQEWLIGLKKWDLNLNNH